MTADHTTELTRRDLLVGGSATAATLALPLDSGFADPAIVTGIVFLDKDGLGLNSPRKGIPDVMVSNGRDVALTDSSGRYVLPLLDEMTVFVIKPAGYMPPVDPATQLPLFYRHHRPHGTPPDVRIAHPGIAPTAPLPASLDFALRRQAEPAAFDVVLLTDPQPANNAEIDYIRDDIADALVGTTAKFGLTAGDLMFDDLSLYERYNRIIGAIGIPWWNIAGNHDLNYEAPDRRYSRETFKRVFGPSYYAFEYAKATFLMLDDVDYLGGGMDRYEGRLDATQLEFVANLLARTPPDRLLVVVLHIPLRTYAEPGAPSANLVNREALFALLKGRHHTVSFAGHTHTTEHHYFDEADGWANAEQHHHHVLTAVCGSWWSGPKDRRNVACADSCDGTPNGFHILSIDGVAYRTRFVSAKEPNGKQVRLTLSRQRMESEVGKPDEVGSSISTVERKPAGRTDLVTLYANIFDGGPKTRANVTIGARAPLDMTRQAVADPFVEDLFARNDSTIKSWVSARPSSHIWTCPLPVDLEPGAHRVVVSAVNEYGDRVYGGMTLEILSTGSPARLI